MASATVGDALSVLMRYSRALIPSIRIEIQQHSGMTDLLVRATHLPRHLERFYCEVLYTAILNSGRLLIGDQTVATRLELDYCAPRNDELYHRLLGPEVYFNRARCALRLDERSLAIPISTANPLLQAILRRECDRLVSLDARRGRVSENVQQVLLQSGTNWLTSATVARQLNMSESTLQRRLAKEGTRYQQVLDQVRYRLAREYLSNTTLPVTEIAYLLGFSDAANFRRSFRRWSGTTPQLARDPTDRPVSQQTSIAG
jgi:AraC-like DNA-binding protein